MPSSTPLQTMLSPELYTYAHTYLISPSSPLQSFLRTTTTAMQTLFSSIAPLLDIQTSSSLVPLLSLSFTLGVAFLLIVWIYRVIAFWTRMAMRMVFWGVVFAIAATVYQRGAVAIAADVVEWGKILASYGGFVKEVWLMEYEKWEAQAEATRAARR